ncbi:ENDOU [Lepeophtheirus salmonis]|uniref:ENDOU n=2 Tax=Lepeophtheirus salmonis TaxID=72036 RepID=A0A7R8CXY6_LEPSM|nr:ENDOU [Lepeophtheirus salmonis]CAF2937058.1 ENDOU [Lepeophtheirus salmonis]
MHSNHLGYLRRMSWRTFLLLTLLTAGSTSCKTGKKKGGSTTTASTTSTTQAPVIKSCEGKCFEAFKSEDPCQCNDRCKSRGNCCDDYESLCSAQTQSTVSKSVVSGASCLGKCNQPFNIKNSCQCNSNCNNFSNCCSDFDALCKKSKSSTKRPSKATVESTKSCVGKCNERFNTENACQCNANCNKFNNCCSDFNSTCIASTTRTKFVIKSTIRPQNEGSCSGKCHHAFSFQTPCQCNYGCEKYNNCCSDYGKLCSALPPPKTTPKRKPGKATSKSCVGKCNQAFKNGEECQCNSNCNNFKNCCTDFNSTCLAGTHLNNNPGSSLIKSCRSKCNELVHSRDSCQCNPTCEKFNNCCPDYVAECKSKIPSPVTKSCVRRCNTKFEPGDVCQCNPNCHQFDNCCPDYDAICENPIIHTDNVVTDNELKEISELLLTSDINNAGRSININSQERKHGCNKQDVAPRRLFTNNYDPNTFRNTLNELWFGIYDRDGDSRVRTLGSSGFEHVFVGELKNNEVGGFHHWVYFVKEEQKGNVEYLGKRGEISLGQYGKGFTGSFLWKNQVKCTGSMTVGTSPELDMALYTICALSRPNVDCKMTLHGKKVTIRAFEFSYRGRTHIGTAFSQL